MEYNEFLRTKVMTVPNAGIEVGDTGIHPMLFDFQRAGVRWALRKGRAALFFNTGMGKSLMELEWARLGTKRCLIFAPLAVTKQLQMEGQKIGIESTIAREQSQVTATGITITNYEMLDKFDPAYFDGVALDESSILKSIDGKTKAKLIDSFKDTPMRLCLTATPAPNDIAEMANHAEFLGVMSRAEMLAKFFVHDDDGWRLKGHAREPFYRWLASWAMTLKKPSDLGYPDNGFILPELRVHHEQIETDYRPDGALFATKLKGITERAEIRHATTHQKLTKALEVWQEKPDEQWLIWCGLNDESTEIYRALKSQGAVEVRGSDTISQKEDALLGFAAGKVKILVSKTRIAGFGMNFQSCHNVMFFGLSDSWEAYYQAVRRCWRFGQTHPVDVHIILTNAEYSIYQNVMEKERQAEEMSAEVVKHVAEYEKAEIGQQAAVSKFNYSEKDIEGDGWKLMLGDSAERLADVADDSIDLVIDSIPFSSLYTYSSTERDLGNSKNDAEFFRHLGYVTDHTMRVMKSGRNLCMHVQQLATTKVNDGVIGLRDFRGDVIRHCVNHGFIYHGEVVIDKDPQAQAIRTHSKALLFVQLKKDASWLRPALADYVLVFRKPGENAVPVVPDLANDDWIEWARPIWYGIRESDTLQGWQKAKGQEDERHICPLQTGTIERCVRLWSNAGEVVMSRFVGIGSEGYVSLMNNRRFVGCELKPEYFELAVKNLRLAEEEVGQQTLFGAVSGD